MSKKRIKMFLYAEPGVGKSVFASQFPRPFFITTDGNYEWLEDFGAKPEDHYAVESYTDYLDFMSKNNLDGYDTIVIDLIEDLFKWSEIEFVQSKKLEHISDLGYGKGYDITRNEFFIEMCKLINKDKNIVFISHEYTYAKKDRRGVEHIFHGPSNRLPDKVVDMIEGRVRYFLRAFKRVVDEDGELKTERVLSLVPKENEFGIIRGVNVDKFPQEIPLDAITFLKTIGYDMTDVKSTKTTVIKPNEEPKKPVVKVAKTETKTEVKEEVKVETPVETKTEETSEKPKVDIAAIKAKALAAKAQQLTQEQTESTSQDVAKEPVQEVKEEVKVEETQVVEIPKVESKEDKIAAIKAKLAAAKAHK